MNAPNGATTIAVSVNDVSFAYVPGEAVLEHVSLAVPQRTRLGILGPNGGGKSTLLKLILGLLEPHSGTIRVFGLSPRQATRSGLVGYLPQRPHPEFSAPLSVRQVVAMTAGLHRSAWLPLGSAVAQRVDHALELVGMTALADRPIGRLSGGQQQRTFIARALAAGPRLLILDEPTVGVDQEGQRRFADLLRTIHTNLDVTILIVSHDLRAIAAGCDDIAVLSRTLHYHAAPEGLTTEVLAEVFHHDIASIAVGTKPGACGHSH